MWLLYLMGFTVPSVVLVVKVTPSICDGFVGPDSGVPFHLMRKSYVVVTLVG